MNKRVYSSTHRHLSLSTTGDFTWINQTVTLT
jgi:hypothetical protein